MQEHNKKNLILLALLLVVGLTIFFTIVLLTYSKGGLWSAPLPVAAVVYAIVVVVKKYLPLTK